jgi:3-hydroxy-9,10-secoandrosta-1,3,5(10)-triene-9,17-dione monooxygenase
MSLVDAPPVEELVERVAALVPKLREKAVETEEARRVLPEHFEALSEAGVFKMCVPRRFGGYEASMQTQCDVLADLARGCPSTSWVATIFSAMAWQAATFPDEAQEEILGDGDPRVSGAFSLTGTAAPVDGGFVLNGRWPFNTGCHGAKWTFLNALVQEGDDPPAPTAMFVRSSELAILDDWYATGMTGTGSNTIVAEDVFVPAYRTQPLPNLIEGRYPARHNSSNPYFNYPTAPFIVVNAGGTPLGIARGALEAFMERLPGRAITYTHYTNQAEAPITHLQVGEAALKVDSAAAHIRLAAEILDSHPGGPMALMDRVRARAHVSHATALAREVTDTLFKGSGASAIQTNVPIQRFQRDIQALANHAIMNPQSTTELYGRILCGLEPNTPIA